MGNNTEVSPSLSLQYSYWRPWYNNTEMANSYLDYIKDVSLAKYSADTVGQYIREASKQQVTAIQNLGFKMGMGLNALSNQMSRMNTSLDFLNKKMDMQIEQGRITNLLLEDVCKLLRVPDSEKERQRSIEMGLKFFLNAQKDNDLFADALEELLKAEQLMKQDYFVLHRIGLIYMYSVKHINPKKALDYFIQAAKYASVENDAHAIRLANRLFCNDPEMELYKILVTLIENTKYNIPLFSYKENIKVIQKIRKDFTEEDASEFIFNLPQFILKTISKEESDKATRLLRDVGAEFEVIEPEIHFDSLKLLVADSYEKAAFAAYVLGEFEIATNHQSKAVNFNESPENLFLLSKYQARSKQIDPCLQNLSKAIDAIPSLAIAVFKDFDLINEPHILKLIELKNDEVDNQIHYLIKEWQTIKLDSANTIIIELNELLKATYDLKVEKLKEFNQLKSTIKKKIETIEYDIRKLQMNLNNTVFITLTNIEINKFILELDNSLGLSLEIMKKTFEKVATDYENDRLKIGSIYAGGTCFYIDESGKHGLVAALQENEAVWGRDKKLGTEKTLGAGKKNTKLITDRNNWTNGFLFKKTAAQICSELSLNGYNDWFLPSIDELDMLCEKISKEEIKVGKNHFQYWSSSEDSDYSAWCYRFGFTTSDTLSSYSKCNPSGFFAVRSF